MYLYEWRFLTSLVTFNLAIINLVRLFHRTHFDSVAAHTHTVLQTATYSDFPYLHNEQMQWLPGNFQPRRVFSSSAKSHSLILHRHIHNAQTVNIWFGKRNLISWRKLIVVKPTAYTNIFFFWHRHRWVHQAHLMFLPFAQITFGFIFHSQCDCKTSNIFFIIVSNVGSKRKIHWFAVWQPSFPCFFVMTHEKGANGMVTQINSSGQWRTVAVQTHTNWKHGKMTRNVIV